MKAIPGVPGQGLVNLDPQASSIVTCWQEKDFLVDNHVHLFTYCQVNVFIRQQQSSVLSRVQLFATPWTAGHQASLSFTISWSLLKLMSIESMMPSNHLILCHSLLLQPSILPNIRVFSSESDLHIRWPKYWSLSFSISPSNKYSGFISFRTHCPRDSQESSPAPQFESINS